MNDDSESRLDSDTDPQSITETASVDGHQTAAPSPPPTAPQQTEAPERTSAPPLTATTGGWQNTFTSLGNRDFRFLWLGLLLMMGGIQMQMVARGYLTYEITSSPFLLGLVNGGFAIPMLSLSLFGGAVADRMERKRVIQMAQATAGLLALWIGVSITTGTVTWVHLLIVSIVQGALFSFLMPARQAIIPELVGQENLTNAMALNAMAMSAATLIAPTVAGNLYAYFGPGVVYYIIAGTAFTSVALTGLVHTSSGGRARPDVPMMSDIAAGLSYIRHSPIVMVLLLMGLATAMFAMPFRFLMPIFVVDVYERGPDAMGLMVTIMGVGALAGSMVVASLGKWRRGLLLIISTFISGIALLLVALIPLYFAAVGIMVLLGIGDAGRRTLNQAMIMEEVEDQYRGRVMSVFMMNFGLMPLAVLPTGAIAEFWGGQAAVGLLAVLLLVTSTVIIVTQKRLREMQ